MICLYCNAHMDAMDDCPVHVGGNDFVQDFMCDCGAIATVFRTMADTFSDEVKDETVEWLAPDATP